MHTRPVAIEDATAIHDLTRRWETFWDAPLVTPLFEITEELERPHLDLEEDTRSYWDGDRMVGYGQIWYRPSGVRLERACSAGETVGWKLLGFSRIGGGRGWQQLYLKPQPTPFL